MTKDFKEETRTENTQYGVSWMLGGVAVGLLAGIVMFKMMGGNPATNAAPPAENTPVSTTKGTAIPANGVVSTEKSSVPATPAPPETTRPGFSYHAVLPVISMDESLAPIAVAEENPEPQQAATTTTEKEPKTKLDKEKTVKPEAKPAVEKPTAKTTTVATEEAAPVGNYMFQLGAYRSQAPALEMQAKARKYGMNTRVEQANVNGQVWYRIRIGPTRDQGVASRWRQSITAMGIDPIMIRM